MRFSRGFRSFGQGHVPPEQLGIPTPEDQPVVFDDFSQGYNVMVSAEQVPKGASPYTIDMEVTARNRLKRAPGTTPVETFVTRTPEQIGLHYSLDDRAELVFFDPPYFGFKGTGNTIWIDAGLPGGRRYGWTVYGDVLVFSNGTSKVFSRRPGEAAVAVLDGAPVARTYASFAARVFGGGAVIDGRYEPMGIAWNPPSTSLVDWIDGGGGAELLISDVSAGDAILKLVPMNLDFMAVVCKESIWVGRVTRVAARPADFTSRVPRIGAVNADTVQLTARGVIFLSRDGVRLFDGNTAPIISSQINGHLLPVDLTQLANYNSAYDPVKHRYYLFTPTTTWVYDLVFQRWYRRSMLALGGSPFAEQQDAVRWSELVGTWADQGENIWADFSPSQSPVVDMVFLGDTVDGRVIAEQDSASAQHFGVPFTPIWELPSQQGMSLTEQFTTKLCAVQYAGSGLLDLYLWDVDGQPDRVVLTDLPAPIAETRVSVAEFLHTGKGIGGRIQFGSGDLELEKLILMVEQQSRRNETAETRTHFPNY